jgi:hypothetical protein
VLKDVYTLISTFGRRGAIRSVLAVIEALRKDDLRWVFVKIFLDPMLSWLIRLGDKMFRSLWMVFEREWHIKCVQAMQQVKQVLQLDEWERLAHEISNDHLDLLVNPDSSSEICASTSSSYSGSGSQGDSDSDSDSDSDGNSENDSDCSSPLNSCTVTPPLCAATSNELLEFENTRSSGMLPMLSSIELPGAQEDVHSLAQGKSTTCNSPLVTILN